METKANHVLIGLFTLGVVAALLLFVLWAAKYSSDTKFNEYDIVFKEAVTGLSVGGIVQYNGISVGTVRDLKLAPNDPRQVIARVRLIASTPVKTDTKAKLAFTGLTGVAFIQLTGGTPNSPLLTQTEGERVPVIVADQSALQKLLNSTEDIATTITSVLFRINKIISDENTTRISKSLANIQALTDSVAGERENLAALIRNAKQSGERLDRTMLNADKMFVTINRELTTRLPGMVGKLDRTLAQLDSFTGGADKVLKENRGALNSFANQGLAQVGPTLTEMRLVLRELSRLVASLQREPAKFLLGRDKPQEFEPK